MPAIGNVILPGKHWFRRNSLLLLALLLALGLTSCSNTRYLSEGQTLFVGRSVEVESEKELLEEKELETDLEEVLRPDPNFSIFGLRPTLWVYNIMGTPKKEKGIRSWIKNNIGEPPVLLEQVRPEVNVSLIENRLNNMGFFSPAVEYEVKQENRKASISYVARVDQVYRIKEVIYPQGDSLLNQAIKETQAESLLKPGDPYNLQTFIDERIRIDQELKNKGYFYFNPDFILFKVDSTLQDYAVKVYVRVKAETPAKARQSYRLNKIIVDTNFSIENDTLDLAEGVRVGKYYYFPDENTFRARTILDAVFLESGQLYTRRDHQLTLSRLMNLGVFQYVNARFTEADTAGGNFLNAHLYLTPMLKKSLRVELQGTTKSTGFAGPGITGNFRNRNFLGGAENFNVNVVGSYEVQVGGGQRSGLNSYEIGANAELQVPRFITPFNLRNIRSEFVPKTRFVLGINFLNRVQFFQMNSYHATYGYIWRPGRTVTHNFSPINLQYVHLLRQTPAFRKRLDDNPFLAQSFENQAIIGSLYNLTFNTQVLGARQHHFHFNVNLDASGNLARLIKSTTTSREASPQQPYTLFGAPFSQYARGEADLRYYLRTGPGKNNLATRLVLGAGIPYGNSSTLPYIKQFSIGGPNSIRAFRARSVGPGPYTQPDSVAFSFFDQTGDIKLESSVEYRFGILPFLKGAVFVDAGNIWLTEKVPPDKRGGKFVWSEVLEELAVGTGFGLRVDAQIFVIRFDLGIPVRVPSLPVGQRTVIDDFAPLSPSWRRQNLVLNIAIGYPF